MANQAGTTFSVVVAAYNQVDFLRETLDSVRNQARPADEVIVVDDGSSDGTSEMVRAEFPEVVLIEQENRGQSIARNRAIARARGDWLCFVDQDDLWHRDKLAAVEAYIADHPGCEAVHHPVWTFSSPGGPDGEWGVVRDFEATDLEQCYAASARVDPPDDLGRLDIHGDSYAAFLERSVTRPTAVAIRRATTITAGCFPPGHQEDWKLFRNVARLTEWHLLERRLAFVRIHGGQTTKTQTSDAFLLENYVETWFGGRPDPEHNVGLSAIRPALSAHGASYRRVVQMTYWAAVRRGDWFAARLCRQLGSAVLPRPADRMYVLVPPPVSWRFERLRERRRGPRPGADG